VLLVLLAASALVFVGRVFQRRDLIWRALFAAKGNWRPHCACESRGALRACCWLKSLLLCGGGGALGVLSAQWMVDF